MKLQRPDLSCCDPAWFSIGSKHHQTFQNITKTNSRAVWDGVLDHASNAKPHMYLWLGTRVHKCAVLVRAALATMRRGYLEPNVIMRCKWR